MIDRSTRARRPLRAAAMSAAAALAAAALLLPAPKAARALPPGDDAIAVPDPGPDGVSLSGLVVEVPDGKDGPRTPLAKALVVAVQVAIEERGPRQVRRPLARTDAKGRFSVRVARGMYRVQVEEEGRLEGDPSRTPANDAIDVDLSNGMSEIDIVLQRWHLTGRVAQPPGGAAAMRAWVVPKFAVVGDPVSQPLGPAGEFDFTMLGQGRSIDDDYYLVTAEAEAPATSCWAPISANARGPIAVAAARLVERTFRVRTLAKGEAARARFRLGAGPVTFSEGKLDAEGAAKALVPEKAMAQWCVWVAPAEGCTGWAATLWSGTGGDAIGSEAIDGGRGDVEVTADPKTAREGTRVLLEGGIVYASGALDAAGKCLLRGVPAGGYRIGLEAGGRRRVAVTAGGKAQVALGAGKGE